MNNPYHVAGFVLCQILFGLLVVFTAAPALAQEHAQAAGERYQSDRADCYNGRSNQDRATCLKEAKAARIENRKGTLNGGAGSYQSNAALRCQALPAADKADCEQRMRGEGTVSGSAEAGGVMRELVVPAPVLKN